MGNSCLLLERRFYQTAKDIHSEIRRNFHILRCCVFGRLGSSAPLFHLFHCLPMRSKSTLTTLALRAAGGTIIQKYEIWVNMATYK
jgi:hypothetical protein